MVTRVSRITTRTGDAGQTRLGDNSQVAKDHPRIAAIGTIDELNCAVGLVRTQGLPADVDALLFKIQNELFDLGGEVCIPEHPGLISQAQVDYLEERVKHYNADFGPLREFILPGGSMAAAHAHMARTICRRAERQIITLANAETINPPVRKYLNRLSDLFFIIARVLNRYAGHEDVLWDHEKPKKRPRRGKK